MPDPLDYSTPPPHRRPKPPFWPHSPIIRLALILVLAALLFDTFHSTCAPSRPASLSTHPAP